MKNFALTLLLGCSVLVAPAIAEEQGNPPLPLLGIEGYGGIFATYSAYLSNPGDGSEIAHLPSFSAAYVHMGQGRALENLMIAETLFTRLELSYAYNSLDTGDLPKKVEAATGVELGDYASDMHNLNARFQFIKEGEFGIDWMPALTAGVHYKNNTQINDFDDDLGGALTDIGITDNDGVDYTLYATKMIPCLPLPVLLDAGLRVSRAAHLGLLGFTSDYKALFEGNVVVFASDRLAFAFEYRMKPNEYREIPGLIEPENNWWTIDIAYVINNHMTVEGGYGHFGGVLTEDANKSWGVKAHYEF